MLKELTKVLLKFFQKVEDGGIRPNSFYEASTTVIPRPYKDTRKLRGRKKSAKERREENYRQTSPKNTDAENSKDVSIPNLKIMRGLFPKIKWKSSSGQSNGFIGV